MQTPIFLHGAFSNADFYDFSLVDYLHFTIIQKRCVIDTPIRQTSEDMRSLVDKYVAGKKQETLIELVKFREMNESHVNRTHRYNIFN